MSRDNSASRFIGRNVSKNTQSESDENEFRNPVNSIYLPSSRTPLHTIPDPSQNDGEDLENESNYRAKFEGDRVLDRKFDALNLNFSNNVEKLNREIGNLNLFYRTPRASSRGKAHSEPNSAQSTPARTIPKLSNNVGSLGACSGSRPPPYTAARGGSSSKVSRGISVSLSEPFAKVPHFELTEDPSFWMDHNVQVLIRIRPINSTETTSQGYGRCLRQESPQTLTWLGHPETRFTFDHIACETISQEKLFKIAGLPMVENCMSGYNSCMFAYGQTGSGKTYTMMGEIYEMDGKLNEDCGITPRIFEYLFSRIRAEEDNHRDENLKYSCKCSFLEIYNEQITDLLEPSSINLQLREDLKKGVYVENLMEYDVTTVNDVIKLLLQGAANRKMAATHMNGESSRSHSVFTCIIESRREKDSMTHLRFGRLNLVDLAGSERQKSSGAEGERLKEAANINKSLSTLGLVIMTLVDVAHGKHRHIPYRDSRLTFLLQDSLGGNSKTTIIANVSPSICSANETLSTLKFAQRAKLIQNNAKVNEDASGDVISLQRQIQQLKGQLTFLLNCDNISRYTPRRFPNFDQSRLDDFPEENKYSEEDIHYDYNKLSVEENKMKKMEAMLIGSLRREKMTENKSKKLEAQIQHMSRLAQQREEDAQRIKLMLRFREEKIKRLEQLADGLVSADKYLLEENSALTKEIQLLQTRISRNPELTRFASENIRLLEQLQLFQDFYEQGERETLIAEVSELRNQLLDVIEGNNKQLKSTSMTGNQDNETTNEMEICKKIIAKLTSEVEELRGVHSNGAALHPVRLLISDTQSTYGGTVKQKSEDSSVEVISIRSVSEDETASYNQAEDEVAQFRRDQEMGDALDMQPNDNHKELTDARYLTETINLGQVRLIEGLNTFHQENCQHMELFSRSDHGKMESVLKLDSCCDLSEEYPKTEDLGEGNEDLVTECMGGLHFLDMQAKLGKMKMELQKNRIADKQYQDNCASLLSHKHEIQHLCEHVEVETTKEVLRLQEHVATIQQVLQERLCLMSQEIMRLRNTIRSKDNEIRALSAEWEKATLDLTSFLVDGHISLEDATDQIESIANSFPNKYLVSEQIHRAVKVFVEKEETIVQLHSSLEDAEKIGLEMKLKLNSLKGATIAITEVQQLENDENAKEATLLRELLNQKIYKINVLERKLNDKEDQIIAAEKRAEAALLVVNWLSDVSKDPLRRDAGREISELNLALPIEQGKYQVSELKAHANAHSLKAVEAHIDLMMQGVLESKNSIYACYVDTEIYLSALQNDMLKTSSMCKLMLQDLTKAICALKKDLMELKGHHKEVPWCLVESPSLESGRITDSLGCANNNQIIVDQGSNQLIMLETSQQPQTFGIKKEEAERVCHNPKEILCLKLNGTVFGDEKIKRASSFINKFEEAQKTMKEADVMLNGLPRANEDAKQMTSWWKQAGEELMMERARLIDEIQLLKSSIQMKEEEFKLLQNQIHSTLVEISNQMSLLEGSFMEIQKDVEQRLKVTYSDIFTSVQDLFDCICNLRSSLEDIWSEITDKGFTLFSLYQCYIGESSGNISSLKESPGFLQYKKQDCDSESDNLGRRCLGAEGRLMIKSAENMEEEDQSEHSHYEISTAGETMIVNHPPEVVRKLNEEEQDLTLDDLISENLSLKKELERKDVLLKGLLFDFTLLQESTSNTKDIKDETEQIIAALSHVRHELALKTTQLDDILIQHRELEGHLANKETALHISNSALEQAKESTNMLSHQNAGLRVLLDDLDLKRANAEELLEEQKVISKSLEKEILRMASLVDEKIFSEVKNLEDELRRATEERDQLYEEIVSLNDKIELAAALADENQAIAVEARQESEASKIYAEQKEEEVKILEHSVEELESTINVLEKKVYEMAEEVERHRLMRDDLKLELQMLRKRMLTVEADTGNMDMECSNMKQRTEDAISRYMENISTELNEARNQIRILEKKRAEQDEEIKHCREYISELVLHSEAQASQYQHKYKILEAMVREVKSDSGTSNCAASSFDRTEKSSTRTRGSSSPFRCITSLVQQMSLEKDQELSIARLRIEELEELAASQQKEVCMLNARLAAAESMTHDVIRDLLMVKLDITNYANLLDQNQFQKLMEEAQQQTQKFLAQEQEIFNLRKQINDLIEEKESFIEELNKKDADLMTVQVTVEQLRKRHQFLTAQNGMLKMDKSNLTRKLAELDEMLKKESNDIQRKIQHPTKIKEILSLRNSNELSKRLAHSEENFFHVNDEFDRYGKYDGRNSYNQLHEEQLGSKSRNQKRDFD